MLRKHMRFFESAGLVNTDDYLGNSRTGINKVIGVAVVVFIIMTVLSEQAIGYDLSFGSYLFITLIILYFRFLAQGITRLSKGLPVSDSFVAANVLFFVPIFYGAVFGLIFGIYMLVLSGVLGGLISDTGGAGEIEWFLSTLNVEGGFFSFCVALGVWFLLALQAFYKNAARRIGGYVAVMTMWFLIIIAISRGLRAMGIKGGFYLSDLVYVLPTVPLLVGGAAFCLLAGIYSWFRCLYLYRHDVKGQEKMSLAASGANGRKKVSALELTTMRRGKWILITGGVLIWVALIIMIFSFGTDLNSGEGEKNVGEIHIEATTPEEYADWNTYSEREGVPGAVTFGVWDLDECIVFPEQIDVENISEYYAKIDGDYSYTMYDTDMGDDGAATENAEDDEDAVAGSGWSEISYVRFLVADYSAEEFAKERERIAGLSHTNEDGITNYMLVDTEHFPGVAYIAFYENAFQDYEYVIADEESGRIIYVYIDNYDEKLPTEVQYQASKPGKVVPFIKANTSQRGYSIFAG